MVVTFAFFSVQDVIGHLKNVMLRIHVVAISYN
jgi:hypothetical protein